MAHSTYGEMALVFVVLIKICCTFFTSPPGARPFLQEEQILEKSCLYLLGSVTIFPFPLEATLLALAL